MFTDTELHIIRQRLDGTITGALDEALIGRVIGALRNADAVRPPTDSDTALETNNEFIESDRPV